MIYSQEKLNAIRTAAIEDRKNPALAWQANALIKLTNNINMDRMTSSYSMRAAFEANLADFKATENSLVYKVLQEPQDKVSPGDTTIFSPSAA